MKSQRRRSIESPTISSILHHDLIVEILLRLPVRSLLRFKSVCKSWLSLISDPQFGNSHFDLAALPTYRCLVRGNDSEIESVDVDAPLLKESSVVKLRIRGLQHPGFLSSCRGFVLVTDPGGDVIVWNPATGVQRRIAENLKEKMIYLNGFGYDKSTDDYLLVLIDVLSFYDYEDEDNAVNSPTRISLFSLKNNSWLYIDAPKVKYREFGISSFNIGSFLNDALHWLATSYETKLRVIVAFDLVERSLSEIPLSKVLASELQVTDYYLMRFMGECLSLCFPGYMHSDVEIWMMKEYKVQSSWTKLFVFSTCNIPGKTFYPACFTKDGDIFGSDSIGRLMKLNGKGWVLDLWPKPDKCDSIRVGCSMYRESLLSLHNDFEEESEGDQLTSALDQEASEDDQ